MRTMIVNAGAAVGLVQDLDQLVHVIDDERVDIVDSIRGLDDGAALDGMHEVGARIGKRFAHLRDLGQRGRVEMPDAGVVKYPQHRRMRVALDGVEHPARKQLEKRAAVRFKTCGRRQ